MLAQKNEHIGKVVGVLMDLSRSERAKLLEESRDKAKWDEESRLAGAFRNGKEEGIKEGIKDGIEQEQIIIAKKALQKGFSEDDTVELTGLSIEEIQNLKE